ncbi:MAG TPA: hypothetical protein VFH74_00450 [Gaiellales bacterium]|nr:hypothetical protein [Gaiellales bacterium]
MKPHSRHSSGVVAENHGFTSPSSDSTVATNAQAKQPAIFFGPCCAVVLK